MITARWANSAMRTKTKVFSRPLLCWTASVSAAMLLSVSPISNANAQSAGVSVDLSVLDDGGYNTNSSAMPDYSGNTNKLKLLMPGLKLPSSSYYGPAVSIPKAVVSAPVITAAPEPEPAISTLTAADIVPAPIPEAPVVEQVIVEQVVESVAVVTPPTAEPEAQPEVVAEAAEVVAETIVEDTIETEAAQDEVVALEPEVPSAPAVEKVVEEVVEETVETASIPATTEILEPGHASQIIFDVTETKVPASAEGDLQAVINTIKADETLRIQLMAYAGDETLSTSKARRLSLSRALAVRAFFIENGIRSTRIDVRALGDKTDQEPLNRVDININER